MAWIEVIDERCADGALAALYGQMVDPESGRVDNILTIHSLHPRTLPPVGAARQRGTEHVRPANVDTLNRTPCDNVGPVEMS